MKIYSVYGLIEQHKSRHPQSHFFDRETLKFFGERISEMRLLKNTAKVKRSDGTKVECYVLSSLQRNHPCGARRTYHYFTVDDLEHIVIM